MTPVLWSTWGHPDAQVDFWKQHDPYRWALQLAEIAAYRLTQIRPRELNVPRLDCLLPMAPQNPQHEKRDVCFEAPRSCNWR
jgi:hypothetical protein